MEAAALGMQAAAARAEAAEALAALAGTAQACSNTEEALATMRVARRCFTFLDVNHVITLSAPKSLFPNRGT